VARVTAEAQAQAQALAAAQKAAQEAEPPEPDEEPEPEGPSTTEQLLAYLVQGHQDLQHLMARIAQPRPAMRLSHERDPATGRIAASTLVPVEPAEPMEAPE
jgi:hypothetical protein